MKNSQVYTMGNFQSLYITKTAHGNATNMKSRIDNLQFAIYNTAPLHHRSTAPSMTHDVYFFMFMCCD